MVTLQHFCCLVGRHIILIIDLYTSVLPSAGLDGRQTAVEHENRSRRHDEHDKWGAELQLIARPAVDRRIGHQSHERDQQQRPTQNAHGDDLLVRAQKHKKKTERWISCVA